MYGVSGSLRLDTNYKRFLKYKLDRVSFYFYLSIVTQIDLSKIINKEVKFK